MERKQLPFFSLLHTFKMGSAVRGGPGTDLGDTRGFCGIKKGEIPVVRNPLQMDCAHKNGFIKIQPSSTSLAVGISTQYIFFPRFQVFHHPFSLIQSVSTVCSVMILNAFDSKCKLNKFHVILSPAWVVSSGLRKINNCTRVPTLRP